MVTAIVNRAGEIEIIDRGARKKIIEAPFFFSTIPAALMLEGLKENEAFLAALDIEKHLRFPLV